jgi:predicted nucleotide-binding protein (sugar kinase/HSP70/actin superfamily)
MDFSMGDDDVVKNLVQVAKKMGFGKGKGKKAALEGIKAQRRFEAEQIEIGQGILKELKQSGQLGVVIYARSYLSQDSGANLGIAEKLAQLGAMPIPLDFLPLDSIDVKQFSDRPYWYYESKHIAGAAITLEQPQLYGLMLTCFGCGPNSFVTNIVEDITDGKPLGHLELDEHAAEAGLVTRLEAFVDTITGRNTALGCGYTPVAFGDIGQQQAHTDTADEQQRCDAGCGHARIRSEGDCASGAGRPQFDIRQHGLFRQGVFAVSCNHR